MLAKQNQKTCISLPLFRSVDLNDLIGGYDQKRMIECVSDIQNALTSFMLLHIDSLGADPQWASLESTLSTLRDLLAESKTDVRGRLSRCLDLVERQARVPRAEPIGTFLRRLSREIRSVCESPIVFKWIDSAVIEALEKGHWVIFENCEQINPALLEKLNGLLEEEEIIELSECLGDRPGQGRLVRKHKDFKAFLVFNAPVNKTPQISKPLMNRCAYIHFDRFLSRVPNEQPPITETPNPPNLTVLNLAQYNEKWLTVKNELKTVFEKQPAFFDLVGLVMQSPGREEDTASEFTNQDLEALFSDLKAFFEKMVFFKDCFGNVDFESKEVRHVVSLLFEKNIQSVISFARLLASDMKRELISRVPLGSFQFRQLFDHFLHLSYPCSLLQPENPNQIQEIFDLAQIIPILPLQSRRRLLEQLTFSVLTLAGQNDAILATIRSIGFLKSDPDERGSVQAYITKMLLIALACHSNNPSMATCFGPDRVHALEREDSVTLNTPNEHFGDSSGPQQDLLQFVKIVFLMKMSNELSFDSLIKGSDSVQALKFLCDPLLTCKLRLLSRDNPRWSSHSVLANLFTVVSELFRTTDTPLQKQPPTTLSLWGSLQTLVTGNQFVTLDCFIPARSAETRAHPTSRLETRLHVLAEVLLDVNRKYERVLSELDERVFQIKDENDISHKSFFLCRPELETPFLYLLSHKKVVFERASMVDGRQQNLRINNSVLEDYEAVGVVLDRVFKSLNRLKTCRETVQVLKSKGSSSASSLLVAMRANLGHSGVGLDVDFSILRDSLLEKFLESSLHQRCCQILAYLERVRFDDKQILELGIYKRVFQVLVAEIDNLALDRSSHREGESPSFPFQILNRELFGSRLLRPHPSDNKIFEFLGSLSAAHVKFILDRVMASFQQKNSQIVQISHKLESILALELQLRSFNIKESVFNVNWLENLQGLQLVESAQIQVPEFVDIFAQFTSQIRDLKSLIECMRVSHVDLSGLVDSGRHNRSSSFTQRLADSLGLFLNRFRFADQRFKSISDLYEFVTGGRGGIKLIGRSLHDFIEASLEQYEMAIFEEELTLLGWMVIWRVTCAETENAPNPIIDTSPDPVDDLYVNLATEYLSREQAKDDTREGAQGGHRFERMLEQVRESLEEECVRLSLSLETSENKRLSKTKTEEGKLKQLKARVEELAVYEYDKHDRVKRQFRKDLQLAQMFKTHLAEFQDEADGVQHDYIRRVSGANQAEVIEELYTKDRDLRRTLVRIRKSEFEDQREAQKSSRELLREFNAVAGVFLKSVGLSVLGQCTSRLGKLGIWDEQETPSSLGKVLLKRHCANPELARVKLARSGKRSAFQSYFQAKHDQFDREESNTRRVKSLRRFCQTNQNLFDQLSQLRLLDVSSVCASDGDSVSSLVKFYQSHSKQAVLGAEIKCTKPSVFELDIVTRLCCFRLVENQATETLLDFYNDQVDQQSMSGFVLLADELMTWIRDTERSLPEMAGMPVLVSVKNLVLKIVKFGSDCPFR